jgi:microcystin-dependent protein
MKRNFIASLILACSLAGLLAGQIFAQGPGPQPDPWLQNGNVISPLNASTAMTFPSTVTGGSKGLGTINATGLYVNGTSVNVVASVANNTVLSNISGLSAPPAANSLSTIIDSSMGNTQGSLLYRNATQWVPIAPGTAGQFLQTNGGVSNPTWANAAGSGTIVSSGTNTIAVYTGSTTLTGQSSLPSGTTAITQASLDGTTKVATDAYADGAVSVGMPIGVCMDYGGSTAPNSSWVLAFGQALSRTGATAAAFAIYGTTYGVGDGSTTFNMPDLRGRVGAGVGNMGGVDAARLTATTMSPNGTTAGAVGGTQTVAGTASVTGNVTVSSGGVSGSITSGSANGYLGGSGFVINSGASGPLALIATDVTLGINGSIVTGAITANGGNTLTGSTSGTVVQPTLLMNKICKVK